MPTVNDLQKRVNFLKDLAEEEDQDIVKVARKADIRDHSKLLKEVAGITAAAFQKDKRTWLQDVADFYNAGLPENGDLLTADDVHGLQWVVERYADKLISEQPIQQSYSTLSTNTPPPYTQQPVALPPPDPRSLPEAELLRSFLLSNYNPRGHLVNDWIENQFKPHYQYLTDNPLALMQILTHNFASAGKIAYDLWAANKQRVSMDPYGQQMSSYGSPQPQPMGLGGMNMPGMPMSSTGQTREEQIDDQRWSRMEKMINRTMQMKYMEMMHNMGGGNQQQAPPPPGTAYSIRDIVDQHGRPTGAKEYIPTPIGYQQNQQESKIMEIMLQGYQSERNILLQKVEGPNTLLEKIATTALASHQTNTDPFEAFKRMLDFSQQLNQQRPQAETKSLEAIKTEIDAKLALSQMNLQERKEEREFNREIEAERASNENVKTYVDSIKDVMMKVAGPAVAGLMQGYMQPGQAQALQAQQQQAQPLPQQPEDYAIAQQQAQQAEFERQRQYEMQQAQIRQQQAKLIEAQRMQQQQQQGKPVEEAIAERTDGQLEQDYMEIENKERELRRVLQKVSAERAKRRLTRSSGIATRAQQQMSFAPPPIHEQTFEERIAAGQQAADEEMGDTIAAGNTPLDTTAGTTNAVQTEMRAEDQEALRASKDGVQQVGAEPMQFGISGIPKQELESQEPAEEEEDYEEEEEEEEGEPET